MRDLPERKNIRLKGYDYSQAGYYFVTVCVKDRLNLLWESVGAACGRPPLSEIGIIIDTEINKIGKIYETVTIDEYVIMPNHIHMIITLKIELDINGRPQAAPTISRILNKFKGSVSKQIGYTIWQKLYHDHIIRNQATYQKIWQYIDKNPATWAEDCYYTENNQYKNQREDESK